MTRRLGVRHREKGQRMDARVERGGGTWPLAPFRACCTKRPRIRSASESAVVKMKTLSEPPQGIDTSELWCSHVAQAG